MRILHIEDEAFVSKSIQQMFSLERFEVAAVDTGETGLSLARQNSYDLIVLDLQLPDMSGIDILRDLRDGDVHTPVLVLSGTADPDIKVRALKSGADDYLTKPFHRDELIARVRAVVRRAQSSVNSIIQIGTIVVDLDAQMVSVSGVQIDLTTKEYEILKLLSQRKGMILSKEIILNQLYNGMDVPNEKIVDVFICKLRKKLGSEIDANSYIKTVWARGYELRDPTEAERVAA
jgi:two-component system cell cycle response regulator CtrA